MGQPDLSERLDRLERQVRGFQAELAEVRALAAEEEALPAAQPAIAVPTDPLVLAWRELERGREDDAIRLAFKALDAASERGDEAALRELAEFASIAGRTVSGSLSERIRVLQERAAGTTAPAPSAARPATVAAPKPAPAPTQAPAPPPPSPAQRLQTFLASELTGSRLFALAGGAVTLLGVLFLFVLAAERGWIGPEIRVSIGASVSVAILVGGIVLRTRLGRADAALAAVGTGIAGAYATLAAATILYGFLPKWGALVVAAAIAATGGMLALRWSSQMLAGISLVGAAAAPGAVALDDGIAPAGTAFAVVVFAAAVAAATPRRWLWLATTVGGVAVVQVIWLTGTARAEDVGAIAVAAVAALVLLACAVGWQWTSSLDGLDTVAASTTFLSGGLAFGTLLALLPEDRDGGVALLVAACIYGGVGYASGRKWRDLGWVAGAIALLFAGVATAFLLSDRSLTIAWAIEAAVLAFLAWRLATPRFEFASLAYLSLGLLHLLVFDLTADAQPGDVATSAVAGMYVLAGAAFAGGTLALGARSDPPSVGVLAALEPLWNRLVEAKGAVRLSLYAFGVALAAAATTGLVTGRWVTILWAGAAVALAVVASALGERRAQGAALALLGAAIVHAVAVEAELGTLVLAREADALAPVPSLAALAVSSGILAVLASFPERGIKFLGPLAGPERWLVILETRAAVLRVSLVAAAAAMAVWAISLLLVAASYDPGQVGATALWAATGTVLASVAARRHWWALAVAAAVPIVFAFTKAAAFDWQELGDWHAAVALTVASTAVVLLGLFGRYAAPQVGPGLNLNAFGCAAIGIVSALVAVDRVAPDRTRLLGVAAFVVAAAVGGLAVPPFRAWRSGRPEAWLRDTATVYWALALVTVGFAEWSVVDGSASAGVALWAVTAGLAASVAVLLAEERLWVAGAAGTAVATAVCIVLVTEPIRIVEASAHPAAGLWALVVCVLSLVWAARLVFPPLVRVGAMMMLGAVALGVFGASLAVLDIAERASTASIETDFQRGHTAVSAFWALLALALFVAGLMRERRLVQRTGLALFGLALAKLFLYDLRNLSSVTRALSFIAVGTILLAAAFFVERMIHGPETTGDRPAGRGAV